MQHTLVGGTTLINQGLQWSAFWHENKDRYKPRPLQMITYMQLYSFSPEDSQSTLTETSSSIQTGSSQSQCHSQRDFTNFHYIQTDCFSPLIQTKYVDPNALHSVTLHLLQRKPVTKFHSLCLCRPGERPFKYNRQIETGLKTFAEHSTLLYLMWHPFQSRTHYRLGQPTNTSTAERRKKIDDHK